MLWLISIEEEPYHNGKLFTHSLNDNKAKSRVIKITLVCVDVIYSHFRISVNCLNHFYRVSLAQMEIGQKHVLVVLSSLTSAGFAKFSAPTSFDTGLDCRIPGLKMANLKPCYRGAAVVLSRCACSPVIVKPGHKIAILKHCSRSTAVVL